MTAGQVYYLISKLKNMGTKAHIVRTGHTYSGFFIDKYYFGNHIVANDRPNNKRCREWDIQVIGEDDA